jgi:glutamate-5-semialdehyde dehydrogenase
MSNARALMRLAADMVIPFGGDRATRVSPALAEAFAPGDALVICQSDGELLHIRAETRERVAEAVDQARSAFVALRRSTPDQIGRFFDAFASRLSDDATWREIEKANHIDVVRARGRGRDIGRLALRDDTRASMIEGLRAWSDVSRQPDSPTSTVDHGGWRVEAYRAPLGTVGFVFEGRPNVLVDACGVLASGNTAVLRIGDDAVGTAETLMEVALQPALKEAGLPQAAVTLLPRLGREAAWALFSDARLALAIARGSGPAVRRLGEIASQSGVPVSLHGVGGAWLVADASADPDRFRAVVEASLDRKVCNTLNTCCIPKSRALDLVPALYEGLTAAASRLGRTGRLHVLAGGEAYVDPYLFTLETSIERQGRETTEPFATRLEVDQLGHEWEWESTPEITLVIVDDLQQGVDLINQHSPRFVAALIAEDVDAQEAFYRSVDAPFVGDGFTRWVDGQYALNEPELGLSNWEFGRPLGRSAVLTGASVHTIRLRMRQSDLSVRR